MEKRVMDFTRSESNSSLESEIPGVGRGIEDADDDESDEYCAYEDDLSSGVNFRPIPPLRSSQSLGSSFPFKSSSSVKDSDTSRRGASGGKDDGVLYAAAIVSMIDRKIKDHANNLLRAAHGISAQVAQLESRTRQLEDLIDNLKDSTEFYGRRTERRLREVEDMMTEVQGGIQDLRDKQKITEVQLQLAKLQQIRADSQSKHQNSNVQNKLVQQQVSYVHQQDYVPHASPTANQQEPCNLPSYGPPSPLQNLLLTPANTATQIPQQYLGQYQSHFVQQFQTFYRPPLPTPDSANQQQHRFPTQSSELPYQPYIHSSFSESSQLPRPETPPSTHHSSAHQVNQHPQVRTYMPSEDSCFPSPKLSCATDMVSPPQQFNTFSTQNINNQPLCNLERSKQLGNFNLNDLCEGPPLQYWSSTKNTSQPMPTLLRTPKLLPRALPMALDVNEVSSSGGTESNMSIEDIVEQVVAMGFRRDTVKATVKKLTENEQPVDLNLVLDKLIHSVEIQ